MKIAIVSHLYPSKSGFKHGTFIRDHAGMVGSFSEVKVWVPTPRHPFFYSKSKYSASPLLQPPEAHRWRFWSAPRHKLSSLVARQYRFLAAEIHNWKPDLIHIHWAFPDAQLVPYISRYGYPTVVQVHGGDWYGTGHVARQRDKALAEADALVTVGKRLKQDISHSLPELEPKIHHIPNWVDPNRFTIPQSKRIVKERLGWDRKRIQVLCVANFKEVKGVHDLVDSLQYINDSNLDLHFVGTDFNDQFSEMLHDKARKIARAGIYFHPPVPVDQLIPFYQAADLFVLPSRNEGFGISLIEAGACGVPLISTHSGGPEEIVDPACGRLAEKQNPAHLGEVIALMLDRLGDYDPSEVRAGIINRFGKEIITKKYQELYGSLIS